MIPSPRVLTKPGLCGSPHFTPLASGRFQSPGCPRPPIERVASGFTDGYGVEDRFALLDAVEESQRDTLLNMLEYGRQGISPYRIFVTNGRTVSSVVSRNGCARTGVNWNGRSSAP